MRVYIGPHTNWIGPYQVADVLRYIGVSGDRCYKIGEWLSNTWVGTALTKLHSLKKRKVKVHIDRYDVWSADHTLAYIILPMLKQLQHDKHGSPHVDDADVPDHLRKTSAPPTENEWDTDALFHDRWEYVLNQMIFAFEQIHGDGDWSAPYFNDPGPINEPLSEYISKMQVDHEGMKAHQAKITEGFRLFGKYFEALWD